MRADQKIGRYVLNSRLSIDPGLRSGYDIQLWKAYDTVLDRHVTIRAIIEDDPRVNGVLGAARAAALVDDRRLLRVLDIIQIPAKRGLPSFVGIVSEWASGENLLEAVAQADGEPWDPLLALDVVAQVSRTLAACLARKVAHGRLRPSSVFVTDAGEVRVRGLAVDAALFGSSLQDANPKQADVDALGCLTYLLTTGYWPGSIRVSAPDAPRSKGFVLPPTQIRANLPRTIDDVVARSVESAARPRDVARVPDSASFATMVGATLDHLAPVTTTVVPVPRRKPVRLTGRVFGMSIAIVALIAIAAFGMLLARPSIPDTTRTPTTDAMLTASAQPVVTPTGVEDLTSTYPIVEAHSFNPLGTKYLKNGTPEALQSENEPAVGKAVDDDPATAWLTRSYGTATLDDKGGVGLVLDLGQTRTIDAISLGLVGSGSDVAVKVADTLSDDPEQWKTFGDATAASDTVDIRVPKPVTGRYVLVWFTRLPVAANGSGKYQGGVKDVTISGSGVTASQ